MLPGGGRVGDWPSRGFPGDQGAGAAGPAAGAASTGPSRMPRMVWAGVGMGKGLLRKLTLLTRGKSSPANPAD